MHRSQNFEWDSGSQPCNKWRIYLFLLISVPNIWDKFDILFPFYHLSQRQGVWKSPFQHLTLSIGIVSSSHSHPRNQNRSPFIPNLAFGLVMADLRLNLSLSSGCRRGSISMFLQTLRSTEESKSRTPSRLCATKPLFLHVRAWLMLKQSPLAH